MHKVQGLSLEKVVVSFDLVKQRTFNYGQMYVALSRVTSLQGLYLMGQYKVSSIKADPKAKLEYNRLREQCVINMSEGYPMIESSLNISLLNTRSLSKHAIDIAYDTNLMASDIICLTETQLSPAQNIEDINENLNNL